MMASLAADGFTDYWAFPIPHARSFHSAMTVATRAKGGFTPQALAALQALLPAIALNLDIIALGRIAENVLGAYLGERSGKRVLEGAIRRGSGETIDAIVWVSDMRDYTGLSDRLSGPDMIRLLNAYFERLAEAVQTNGGEVLKFIGDGMLAIFPVTEATPAAGAAKAALRAARAGLSLIAALNRDDGDALAIGTKWRPLDLGIALHRGSVFYGNIGAPDRLDFTVTGPAVNLAARVEPLAKETGRRLLMTEAVANLLDEPVERLGSFAFRGVAEPVAVFAAPE
jgi:adenylate cyclase